jgi:hypothetical protein
MAIAGAVRSRVGSPLGGFARPLKAASSEDLPSPAASRYRGRGTDLRRHLSLRSRRRKEAKANAENTGVARRRHPDEPPIDPLENTISRLRSSAGMRKEVSFTGGSALTDSPRLAPPSTPSGQPRLIRFAAAVACHRRALGAAGRPPDGTLKSLVSAHGGSAPAPSPRCARVDEGSHAKGCSRTIMKLIIKQREEGDGRRVQGARAGLSRSGHLLDRRTLRR